MHTIAGTPYFISPEVLKGNYDKECDIWSFGVVLYLLLSGVYPFDASNRGELFEKINKGHFEFPDKYFLKISSECKDLIKKMICVDRKARISAHKVMDHPWIKKW
jgi:calcium-dependent protein kinase